MRTASNLTTREPQNDRFRRYSLSGLIPEDSVFIVDMVNMSLNLVNLLPGNVPDLQEQRIATPIEFSLILELLAQFPNYCPFENLLQAHEGLTVERQRERLGYGKDSFLEQPYAPFKLLKIVLHLNHAITYKKSFI